MWKGLSANDKCVSFLQKGCVKHVIENGISLLLFKMALLLQNV